MKLWRFSRARWRNKANNGSFFPPGAISAPRGENKSNLTRLNLND
jgi:hypothetical protein